MKKQFGSHQQCQHAETLLYLLCVDWNWVAKWVQCCAAVACGAVYAAVLSVSVWLTGVRLVIASQAAVGEMEAVEDRDGESLSFHSGISLSDTHPHPRIVDQHQQMTEKGTAQLQTCPHQDCVCVFVLYVCMWLAYASVNTWDNAKLLFYEISIFSQWWSDVAVLYNPVQLSLLTALCPLLTDWLNSGHQNADCFPKTWFHKWKSSICFPTASHMSAIATQMNWSR